MSEWENKWMEWLEITFYIWCEKWHFPRTQDPLAMKIDLDKLYIVIKCSQLTVFRLEVKKVKKKKIKVH